MEKKNRSELYLISGILLIGLILRVLFIINSDMGPDEAVYGTRALEFVSNARISTVDQAPVWFFLTDIFMSLFGATQFALRLLPLLASLSLVALVYVITKKFYGPVAGMLSAIFLALSSFSIHLTYEMDVVMTFFIFLSFYFLLLTFDKKDEKSMLKMLMLCLLSLSIAVAIKFSAIIVFLLYAVIVLYYERLRSVCLKPKNFGLLVLVASLGLIPLLVYNILVQHYFGFYDLILTTLLNGGVENTMYQGLSVPVVKLSNFIPITVGVFSGIFSKDVLLLILGVCSLFLIKKIRHFWMLWAVGIVTYLPIALSTGLFKHYVFLPVVLAVGAGIAVYHMYAVFLKKKIPAVAMLLIVFAVLCIIQSANFAGYFETGARTEVREWVKDTVPERALVIFDARIYTSYAQWMGNDKNMVTSINFLNLMKQFESSENTLRVPLYYIRCESGDCGWGKDIAQQLSDVDASLVENFKGAPLRTFKGTEDYEVYAIQASIPVEVHQNAYRLNNFYMHSLRWQVREGSVDHYSAKGFYGLLHFIAFIILLLISLVALVGLFYPYVLILRER